jgi:maleylacetate reductase
VPAPFAIRFGATEIEFGAGAFAGAGRVLRDAGLTGTVACVASPSQVATGHVDALREALGDRLTAVYAEAEAHAGTPMIDRAAERCADADVLLVLGGGGAIGVGKALAARSGRPLVAVPTTYSGSELTALYGISDGGRKRVLRDERARPAVVLYDPELTRTLSPAATVGSVMNCLAHALEASWVRAPSPVAVACAKSAAEAIAHGLPLVLEDPTDVEARGELMAGGMFGGLALATGAMAVHHAICHALGGATGASHGALNALVLPIAMRLNLAATEDVQERLVGSLRDGLDDAPGSCAEVVEAWTTLGGLPGGLSELGVTREIIAGAAAEAAEHVRDRNPVSLTPDEIATALEARLNGVHW